MTKDRYLIWPAGIAVGVPFGFFLIQSFSSSTPASYLMLFVLIILAYLMVATGVLYFSIYNLWCRRWRSGLSSATFPLLALCFLVRPATLIWLIFASNYVHYFALHDVYQEKVNVAHDAGKPRLIWFYWWDASSMGGETLVYLVYDESDEFARPTAQRSSAWNTLARDTFLEQTQLAAPDVMPDKVHHLLGHYYVVYVDV